MKKFQSILAIRDLLNEETHTSYLKSLDNFKDMWSKAFTDYYMKEIHPEVLSMILRCWCTQYVTMILDTKESR